MSHRLPAVLMAGLALCSTAAAGETAPWWNARWRMRTTVARPTPYRDA